MAERNASNVNDFPLQKAVKLVISGVKKSGQISENDFKARLVVPYELSKDEVAELVNKFEDSGISIVDEKGEPSSLSLQVQEASEQAEAAEKAQAASESERVYDSVRMYLKEIGKVPLLSRDEEVAVAKRIEAGDESAKDELAAANPVSYTHLTLPTTRSV